MAQRYPPFEPARVVEGRMYEGFPSSADESRMQAFHVADWCGRAEIAETIEDERYRELARRLVFVNVPDVLADPRRAQLETWLKNRRHGREGVEAGRTLSVAIEELEKLPQEKREGDACDEIRAWLTA